MKTIPYFGCGANRDADMMEAIVGRRPEGVPAVLGNYELCVQSWDDIPKPVRDILQQSWENDFRSYSIRHADGASVEGMLWYISEEEHRSVGEWELHGMWYQPASVAVLLEDGRALQAETEAISDPNIKEVVDGHNYETFLNKKERMLEVANRVRKLSK